MDHRAGLDDLEKRKFLTLPELELRSLGHSALSRYTDYAIPVPKNGGVRRKINMTGDRNRN
jgi:hypothetical protein